MERIDGMSGSEEDSGATNEPAQPQRMESFFEAARARTLQRTQSPLGFCVLALLIVTATNVGGTANGADANFTTTSPLVPDKALQISTRVDVEAGEDVGIGGFIITGTDPKLVVIRGIGPSLSTATPPVAGALSDPFLELHDSTGAIIATNDNWKDNSAADQATLINDKLAPTEVER